METHLQTPIGFHWMKHYFVNIFFYVLNKAEGELMMNFLFKVPRKIKKAIKIAISHAPPRMYQL